MNLHGEKRQQIWEAIRGTFINVLADMLKQFILNQIATELVQKSAEAANIASATATGTAIASAYATPAALAATASFGGAAVAGAAGLTSTVGVARALAAGGTFEQGGLIGGRSHSQGGTLIEAERGEFIVRKDAVNKIGLENLERINNLVDVLGTMPVLGEGIHYGVTGWTDNAITRSIVRAGRVSGKFQEGGLVGGTPPVNISNLLSAPEVPTASPSQITVNISGNVLSQDYVEGELAEGIKEAIRRGTDFGVS